MTRRCFALRAAAASVSLIVVAATLSPSQAQQQPAAPNAQEQTGTAQAPAAPARAPLTEDQMKVLVAPIALYPDELVAVMSQASLYPLQIVEAARFLEQRAKDKSLKPKASWDSSVISLLNYPDIVKMMSVDIDWTQQLGSAVTYQQKDVLVAVQQLRDQAVAKGILKSDEKMKVSEENGNVVVQSANPERIYVPRYQPQMLYLPDYPIAPISYYPDYYYPYWFPTAPFFAAAVTGLVWASAIDWNGWGFWGGRWGSDVNINCNQCFNNRNFTGSMNFNDVDWRNVDRSRISINHDQLAKFDRANVRNSLKSNSANNLQNRTAAIRNQRAATVAGNGNVGDVRRNTLEGLRSQPSAGNRAANANRPNVNAANANRANASRANPNKPNARTANVNRPSGKAKPAGRIDNRPRNPSALGHVRAGRTERIASNRGARMMRGGAHGMHAMAGPRGGGGHAMRHGGGRRR